MQDRGRDHVRGAMAEPIQIPTERMTRAEYYAWAEAQAGGKFELLEGQVVAMAPERALHVQTKTLVWSALRAAIRDAGVPCQAFGDGLAVEIGQGSAYQPDALVNCGDRIPGDIMVAPNPVVVVEVASPSTSRIDAIAKFADYMRLVSVRHYLLVDAVKRIVIHHAKEADDGIRTAIQGAGPLRLDPPGITIRVEDLFEEEPPTSS